MKKLLALLLAVVLCFSLCACGGKSSAEKENISGTYKNISFMKGASFVLNENSTYDRVFPNEKGTYKSSSKGGFVLTDKNDDETVFAKKDNYYYRTNLICCFEKDEDYGLEPTFNDKGFSNQWFCAYYDSISDNKWNVVILQLNEDGTFKLRDCIRNSTGSQTDEEVYEGKYSLDDYVLNLNCEDNDNISFLFIDGKIYFDVFEKQQ